MSESTSEDGQDLIAVQESGIHGRGLFAKAPIPAESLILRAAGRRTRRNGDHVLWLVDDEGRDRGLLVTNEARYVNHDDEPNACFYGEELWSLRAIRAGEEITHDYGRAVD